MVLNSEEVLVLTAHHSTLCAHVQNTATDATHVQHRAPLVSLEIIFIIDLNSLYTIYYEFNNTIQDKAIRKY